MIGSTEQNTRDIFDRAQSGPLSVNVRPWVVVVQAQIPTLGAVIGRETRVLLRQYLEQGMSKAAVVRRLGISERTVYRWTAAGQLDREVDEGPVE